MFNNVYRERFKGLAIGRVERNQDFTAGLGFYHNEFQIQYIYGGERYFFCNGTCYRMEPGTIAFIDKNSIVRTCIIGGKYHDRMLIEIEEKYFSLLCDILGISLQDFFSKHHGVYMAKGNPCLESFVRNIDETMKKPDSPTREQNIKLDLLQLITDSYQWESSRIKKYIDTTVQSSIEKQKRVYAVADYISAHYAEISGLDDLSVHFYMSNAYLSRIFKEVTNFTVSEYINLHRIAASRQYLLDNSLSMQEISSRLGYDSLTYFERVFKKQMSITPLQYRKLKMQ